MVKSEAQFCRVSEGEAAARAQAVGARSHQHIAISDSAGSLKLWTLLAVDEWA